MTSPIETAAQSQEAEQYLIAGLFAGPGWLVEIADLVTAEDFSRPDRGAVFRALACLIERDGRADGITLKDELRSRDELGKVVAPAYIEQLEAAALVGSDLVIYARIVADAAKRRRVAAACQDSLREITTAREPTDVLFDRIGQRILDATSPQNDEADEDMGAMVRSVYREIEDAAARGGAITGIPSGLEALDEMTSGWHRGELIVVAGRPAMGKTALVMGMAAHASDQGVTGGIFSLEMKKTDLTFRLVSSEASIELQELKNARLGEHGWKAMARGMDRVSKLKLRMSDRSGATLMQIRAKCRRWKMQHGLGLVVIDYLQLMGHAGDVQNREREIAQITSGLKTLAKDLDVPVIALSQLNRDVEKRKDKRPTLSDLRESGAIEQDADVICFVYRDEVYDKASRDKGVAELIVAKQRNGAVGTVRVSFEGRFTRFSNLKGVPWAG